MTPGDGGAPWLPAVAWALTGEALDLVWSDAPAPEAVVAALEASGWPADRIAEHARSRTEAGLPWPHRIPDDLRGGLGAAQLYALLGRVRGLLGLDGLEARGPSSRTALTADERRLLAEVPPHHVAH